MDGIRIKPSPGNVCTRFVCTICGGTTDKTDVHMIFIDPFDGQEKFVSFETFPWFRDVAIGALLDVEHSRAGHLHWPALDVDLAVESIEHPERFPLVSRTVPRKHERRVGVEKHVPERRRRRRA